MMTESTVKLFFSPCDVWMFRDSRPFDAEDDHTAAGMFPPLPTVLQGALRTAWLLLSGTGFADYHYDEACPARAEIGPPGSEALPEGRFMRGPFVAQECGDRQELWFPAPANLQADGRRCLPAALDGLLASSLDPALLPCAGQGPPPERLYVRGSQLARYLAGDDLAPNDTDFQAADLAAPEPRLGLMLQPAEEGIKRKTARAGYLWSVAFSRLREGFGLAVETNLSGVDFGRYRLTRLGGEGRGARVSAAQWEYPVRPVLVNHSRFLLYLATPALFVKDDVAQWQPPGGWPAVGLPPTARLCGYRPAPGAVTFGGWDMAGRRPRPNRRGVPAGSVYFFQCEQPLTAADDDLLHQRHGAPLPGPLASAGTGITFVGGW